MAYKLEVFWHGNNPDPDKEINEEHWVFDGRPTIDKEEDGTRVYRGTAGELELELHIAPKDVKFLQLNEKPEGEEETGDDLDW